MSEEVNWEEKYRALMKDFNDQYDKLRDARSLLADCLDCGTMDVDAILEMESNFEGTAERAVEMRGEFESDLNFGLFVMATKEIALASIVDELEELANELDDEEKPNAAEFVTGLRESFQDMIIDDNYVAWGGVAGYGICETDHEDLNHEAQDLFADYVGDAQKADLLDGLKKLVAQIEEDKDEDAEE